MATDNTEVKRRFEEAEHKPGGLRNELRAARKQLPASGPGMIAVLIPDRWGAEPEMVETAQLQVREFLRGTARVNAVMIIWESFTQVGQGGIWALRFMTEVNHRARTTVEGLSELARPIKKLPFANQSDLPVPF